MSGVDLEINLGFVFSLFTLIWPLALQVDNVEDTEMTEHEK